MNCAGAEETIGELLRSLRAVERALSSGSCLIMVISLSWASVSFCTAVWSDTEASFDEAGATAKGVAIVISTADTFISIQQSRVDPEDQKSVSILRFAPVFLLMMCSTRKMPASFHLMRDGVLWKEEVGEFERG